MDKKHMKLPKEHLVEPEELRITGDADDVEGHGLPTTAPPSFGPRKSPGHGGEVVMRNNDDEDDVEGHKRHT
jgi:hypothetical protein